MAQHRPKVPAHIMRALLQQTGGKCANPGCGSMLLEIHHIKEWAVYQAHDEESMIAICPACHSAVTRGALRISDEELYRWKGIERTAATMTGSLFIEPGPMPRLVLGAIEFSGPEGVTIFEFENTKLSLVVREQELAILNLKMRDSAGEPLVDVVDNYVRQRSTDIRINTRPGHYQVLTGNHDGIYPEWALKCLAKAPPPYNEPAQFDALDIHVLEPGIIRIKGVLLGDSGGLVIDDHQILLLSRKMKGIISMTGPGRSILYVAGPIDQSFFSRVLPPDFW
jgi:HNH endonuclease